MINSTHFRGLVVVPTLKYLHPEIPYSDDAVELLMMTAAHESKMGTYLKQIEGPALGVYQMEPITHRDIWDNFLKYKSEFCIKINKISTDVDLGGYDIDNVEELVWNLVYATAMARVHYYRVKEPLPKKEDIAGMAAYAKTYYNTEKGKATVDDYAIAYAKYCL